MVEMKAHWEDVYTRKSADAVSWFQAEAVESLALIRALALPHDAAVIDVGGGASTLVDGLWADGFRNLTVLDLSAAALAVARERLGTVAGQVNWVTANVLELDVQAASITLWHDRAVFHFLTDPADQARYVERARDAVMPGGFLVIGTFAEDGPTQCSGLPVARYDAESLSAKFAPGFKRIAARKVTHTTPWGAPQSFTFVVLSREA